MKKIFCTLIVTTICFLNTQAQLFNTLAIDIPININGKDANANGYYNSFTSEIIIEQQNDGIITRLLYDTSFILKNQYTNSTKDFTIGSNKKKASLIKEFFTEDGTFGVYAKKNIYSIVKYDFNSGRDTIVSQIILQEKFKDERLVSILSFKNKVAFLTITDKSDGLIFYDHNYTNNKTTIKEFLLPKLPLTKEEIKERGKHLAVNYNQQIGFMYTAELSNPDKYRLNTGAQLYYDNENIFILLRMPYKAGIHALQINTTSNVVSFENYIVNQYNPSALGTALEIIPIATAIDSFIVIKNSNNKMLEYYIYNLYKKTLVAHHKKPEDSLQKIVHSPLLQFGTYSSKDQEKELKNEKRFLRRINEGIPFIKAFKDENDSLILTIGGFKETQGVEGTMLSMLTMGFVGVPIGSSEAFGFLFYLSSKRNKFLFAHSKFSNNGLNPSISNEVKTKLNNIASDKLIDDLERTSSFAIEVGNKLYLGVFSKKKGKYDLYVY